MKNRAKRIADSLVELLNQKAWYNKSWALIKLSKFDYLEDAVLLGYSFTHLKDKKGNRLTFLEWALKDFEIDFLEKFLFFCNMSFQYEKPSYVVEYLHLIDFEELEIGRINNFENNFLSDGFIEDEIEILNSRETEYKVVEKIRYRYYLATVLEYNNYYIFETEQTFLFNEYIYISRWYKTALEGIKFICQNLSHIDALEYLRKAIKRYQQGAHVLEDPNEEFICKIVIESLHERIKDVEKRMIIKEPDIYDEFMDILNWNKSKDLLISIFSEPYIRNKFIFKDKKIDCFTKKYHIHALFKTLLKYDLIELNDMTQQVYLSRKFSYHDKIISETYGWSTCILSNKYPECLNEYNSIIKYIVI